MMKNGGLKEADERQVKEQRTDKVWKNYSNCRKRCTRRVGFGVLTDCRASADYYFKTSCISISVKISDPASFK